MTHDIVVRGGQLVDGTGAEPVRGDLAIDDGVITAAGEVDGNGREEIDAEGHMVTPYRATLVNGRVNVRDGEHTGTRAGQVLRHQA